MVTKPYLNSIKKYCIKNINILIRVITKTPGNPGAKNYS